MTGSCTFERTCRRILGKRSDDRHLLIAKSSILHSAVFVLVRHSVCKRTYLDQLLIRGLTWQSLSVS